MNTLEKILIEGAESLNIALNEDKLSSFRRYYEFLNEKSKVMNLTAISGEKDVAALHFLDSLALTEYFDFSEKRVIDIGSGAGFPGMPMKLCEPSMELTMLDAQQKRVVFLQELCRETEAKGVICIHARAEEAALKDGYRDSFDFAVSRAVAKLNVLCELCLPFVKCGGHFVAMKSADTEEEINEAKSAIKKLGGEICKVADYSIPGTDVVHRAVMIQKKTPTPKGYPRRFAKIQKAPL